MNRVLRGAPGAACVSLFGDDGQPAPADLGPSGTAYDDAGAELYSGSAPGTDEIGVYESPVPTDALGVRRVEWAGTMAGEPFALETFVEVVGGFTVSLPDLRKIDPLGDASYTDADLEW